MEQYSWITHVQEGRVLPVCGIFSSLCGPFCGKDFPEIVSVDIVQDVEERGEHEEAGEDAGEGAGAEADAEDVPPEDDGRG